jgi:hypothetical protein
LNTTASGIETNPTNARVTIVDVDMPFGSMVRFIIKWTFASIPAFLIVVAVGFVVGAAVKGTVDFVSAPSTAPGRLAAASTDTFGVGSSKEDVRAIQGVPTAAGPHVFVYGDASVSFDENDHVVRWTDPRHSLRINK